MTNPINIALSGPSFSFLIYENTKSNAVQEGFLLGEIVRKESKTITDNDQEQVIVSETIHIKSVVPCPLSNYFYNGIGEIDKTKIVDLLGDEQEHLVGWYCYHKTDTFKFTMRKKIIHKQLQELSKVPPHLFTCCLLVAESSENQSTHSFSQIFLRRTVLGYDRVAIGIANLSQPNSSYRTPNEPSQTFSNIVKELEIDLKNSPGLVAINGIHSALEKYTANVVEELAEAETKLYELESSISDLNAEILKKMRMKI